MNDRQKAVTKAKVGYVLVATMLLINLMLASFVFFDLGIVKVREIFLAVGTLILLLYAVLFPTKLLPSGSYLLRMAVFLMLPHILIELISTPMSGTISIVAYVIAIIISLFCAYICLGYHTKVVKYITSENYNDYAFFEYKTYKSQEINIYTLGFVVVNFFVLMAGGSELATLIVGYVNLLVAITLNYYRTKAALSDKVKMSHYVLESISTFLAYTLVIVINFLELPNIILIGAVALMVPTVVLTIIAYKSIDHFMYK